MNAPEDRIGGLTLEELERLYTGIGEALDRLPPGGDRRAAIQEVGRRLGIPTPDVFIASFLTAEAGGDVREDPRLHPPPS